MAAYTSVANGDWSSTATWGGTGPPGDGDTATVAHNVDITTSVTVGASGATGTVAVAINSGKTLAVKAGGTLIQRGDVSLSGGTLSFEAGSVHRFDPPTGSSYRVVFLSGAATCNYLGTTGSRCTVSTTARGGGAGFYAAAFSGNQGVKTCQYTDFTNVGGGTNLAPNYYFSSGPGTVTYDHNTFTNCGTVKLQLNALTNITVTYTDNVHNTPGTTTFSLGSTANNATGSRTVARNTFFGRPAFFGPMDLICEDNYFDDFYQLTSTSGLNSFASFKGNFVQVLAVGGGSAIPLDGSLSTECYFYGGAGGNNAHMCLFAPYRDATVDNCIIEVGNTSGDGDLFFPGSPSSPRHYAMTRIIKLPDPNGNSSGTLFSWLGNANSYLDKCEHCTFYLGAGAESSGGRVGETFHAFAGMIGSFKGNLCWDTSNKGGFKLCVMPSGAGADTDTITAANCDYNGGYNFATTPNSKGYDGLTFSSGSPGAHDVQGDPLFVDPTRDLVSWNVSKGGAGTVAAALARLQANPLLCRTDLIPWVRAGFVPQNAIYLNASYPGDPLMADMGAVPVSASTPTAGTATFVGSGPAGISLTATEAILGSPPYTHRWQRKAHTGSTWADLSDVGTVTGSATLSLFDGSASAGVLYDYRCRYTDAASTPVFSAAVPVAGVQVYPGGPIGGSSRSSAPDYGGGY